MTADVARCCTTSRTRLDGFDVVRVLAAAAVFYQHACSLHGREDLVELFGLRIGRIGTAAFFALSGYLAASSSRSPEAWFVRRLFKLFPPFWIVTGVTFAAAYLTGYKSFAADQVICQLLGIGMFTHGDTLVGVSTWFVSALLVLYAAAYLDLRSGGRAAVGATVFFLMVAAVGSPGSAALGTLATHGVTFLLAYLAGRAVRAADGRDGSCRRSGSGRVAAGLFCGAAVLAGLTVLQPEFRYGAVALSGLATATLSTGACRIARRFAAVSYEWFLVHGLSLHLVLNLGADQLGTLLVGAAVVSILAAVVLQRLTDRLVAWWPVGSSGSVSAGGSTATWSVAAEVSGRRGR